MNSSVYRQEILDYWRHPRHFGKLDKPDTESFMENTLCGDAIGWTIRLAPARRGLKSQVQSLKIKEATFYGEGCALSIAGASVLAQAIQGMTLDEAKKIHANWPADELKITPGPSREKCVTLGLEAFKKALEGVK